MESEQDYKVGDDYGWGKVVQVYEDHIIVQYPTWTKRIDISTPTNEGEA